MKVVINAPTKRRTNTGKQDSQAKPGIFTTATPNIYIIPRPAGETITAASVPVPQGLGKKLTTTFTAEAQTIDVKPTASFIQQTDKPLTVDFAGESKPETKESGSDAKTHEELMQEHYAKMPKQSAPKAEAKKLLSEKREQTINRLEKLYEKYKNNPKNSKLKVDIEYQEELLNEIELEMATMFGEASSSKD